jgi:cytochrome c-type biogenesis protein CcmH/NrfF
MVTKKRTVEVVQFYDKCPVCGKEIVADSEKRLAYQMSLHKKLSHGEKVV